MKKGFKFLVKLNIFLALSFSAFFATRASFAEESIENAVAEEQMLSNSSLQETTRTDEVVYVVEGYEAEGTKKTNDEIFELISQNGYTLIQNISSINAGDEVKDVISLKDENNNPVAYDLLTNVTDTTNVSSIDMYFSFIDTKVSYETTETEHVTVTTNTKYIFKETISVNEISTNIESNVIYSLGKEITFENAVAELDNISITSGTAVSTAGEHTLVLKNINGTIISEIKFAVNNLAVDQIDEKEVSISTADLIDNETYYNKVSFTYTPIENAIYTLDGENLTNDVEKDTQGNIVNNVANLVVSKTGAHSFKISYNGKEYTYSFYVFTIENYSEFNAEQYNSSNFPTTINFTSGTGYTVYLNGKETTGTLNITSFGNQIIEVKNGNELIDRVSFVVDPIVTIGTKTINLENGTAVSRTTDTLGNEVVTEPAYSTNDKLLQFDKETTFKYTLNAVSFTRNGKKVSNNSSTNNPGRNVLVLKGINGYSTNIMFFINPKTNLKDNYTYKGQVLPTSTGGTLKLNGDSFISGTTVNTSGKYKFDIYGDYNNLTLVKTYTFDIYPEILNVSSQDKSKPQIFTSSVIPAKTNNKMYYTFNDGEKIDYTSGKALYEVGSYTFYLENVDNTASTGVKTSTYYFEIKQEIATEVSDNIIEGEEFFDEFQVLFTGKQNAYIIYDDAVINEGKVQSGTTKLISNGDILTTIGVYYISYDYVSGSDVNNATWKSFKISPTLNVEDSHAYLSNQDIKLFNENKTFSTDGLNLYLTSEHGTKATSNLTKDELQSLETPNVLSSGTYSLKITGTNNYEKVINFIIVDSNKVNVGSRYINGTSFDFDMYGVTVYVNAPQTRKNITEIQLTNTYEYDSPTKTAESIKTVGKHYFTYSFKLNDYFADTRKYIVTDSPTFVAGVKYYKLIDGKYIEQTVEDGAQISTNEIYYVEANTDSAIYFYITPVIKYNGAAKDSYTTTNVNYSSINLGTSKESVTISMKDGFGQDYIEYEMDAQSKDFAFNVEYNKIGNHYITIILGDISIKASFTVATDIIITDGNELLVDSTIFKEYTNLITTTKAYLVLDNKFAKYENIDDSIDIYGKDIISVGNHTITIVGTNNYSVTKNFIIKEIIEYTGQSKNGQITSEEAISTFTDKNLVIENTIYYSSNEEFTINLYGKSVIVNSTINGEDVDLTTSITKTKIGNYTLKITGVSYSAVYYFIIKDNLKINDKAPVDTYTETVKVSLVNDIEITSNVDATFNRENTIKTVGHYELIVKGVGAYEKKYTFDILNNMLMSQDKVEFEGISSKTIYDVCYFKKQYDATDFKTIMVNGTEGLVASVSTVGKYNIVATNANDEEVINVTIFLSESLLFNETGKANASKIYETLVATYVKNENSNVKLGTVTVSNEQTLDSIKTLGKTIITIKGEGSYTNSYTVFIKETVTPSLFTSEATATLEANKIEYKDALGYTFNTNDIVYKSVKLDDKDYTNGSKVDQYGLHTIVVTGVDYTNTYYVFIKLSNYVITEDSSTGAKTISNVNAPMFINEEKVAATFENDSYTFNYVDEYTLKFTGNKTQTVTDKVVVEPIIGFENGSVYYHAITPTLTLNPNLNRNGKIVIATDEVSPVVIGSYTNIDDIKMVNEIGKYTFTITTYLGSSRIYNMTYKFEIHPTINYVSSDITDITVNSLGYENKVEVIVKDDNTLNASIDYSNANVKINGSTLTVKDNVI
ncbi:MAG: hypothetical protein K6G28_04725, partial [Acholeplasmatales bacterium]|nr:hypothetical protein [Acholeplasmatales bacterium]